MPLLAKSVAAALPLLGSLIEFYAGDGEEVDLGVLTVNEP